MGTDYPPTHAPRFRVSVGSTTFNEYSGELTDLVVDTTTEGADHFSVRLVNPFDHEHVEFDGLEWSTFEPGSDAEIAIGYGERGGELPTLFTGTVASLEPVFPRDSPPYVTVSGFGPVHEMTRGTNAKSWEETTLKAVVDDVAGGYFGDVTIEDAGLELERIIQNDKSDYRFLSELASRYGFECFAHLGNFYFRPKNGGSSPDKPVATLYYGESLETFTAQVSLADQVGTVEVRHWDQNTNAEIVAEATGHGQVSGKEVYRTPVESETEAADVARAKASRPKLRGTGETFGVPELTAGEVVELDGIGSEFTKSYYITGTTHRVDSSGYNTSFDVTELNE